MVPSSEMGKTKGDTFRGAIMGSDLGTLSLKGLQDMLMECPGGRWQYGLKLWKGLEMANWKSRTFRECGKAPLGMEYGSGEMSYAAIKERVSGSRNGYQGQVPRSYHLEQGRKSVYGS